MRKLPLHLTIRRSQQKHDAFTLPELLVVMGIIAILIAVSAPLMSTIRESTSLTQAGQLLGDQINLARQIAAAQNKSVEVRLIRTPDGEIDEGYNAIQLWLFNHEGQTVPASRLVSFPRQVIISENESWSPAMSFLRAESFPNDAPTLAGAEYKSFRIKPNGIISPVITMTDFSMLVVQSNKGSDDGRPDNYVAVQVNPLTGTPSYYRP